MVLKVVSLYKRNGSDNWWYRKRIPADVQRILAKLPNHPRPKGWYKTGDIIIPTGTPDKTLAKAKATDIAAGVERKFKALREGPKPLTAKQVSALCGIVYRAFAEGLEDNPGLTSQQWLGVADENRAAQRGEYGLGARLGIYKNEGERRDADMENRFGAIVDATLTREAIIVDEDSRWQVIEAVARDLTEGVKKLARNADGDFTPDTYVNRFPLPTALNVSVQTSKSLTGLADAWHTDALSRGARKRTAKRWKPIVLRFKDWLGHDDLGRITPADVQRWGDERSAEGKSAKTINDTDFAALRAVFKWGKQRGWLSTNPAAEAKIEGRGKKTTREKWFLDHERAVILNTALAVQGTKRENPKTTAAKRWVPWLCAYSGARVVEMIQLRKADVKPEQGGWVIRINPEAGDTKTNDYRDVPVHDHLIAVGFIEFLQQSKPGHLFCDLGKDGTTAGPADGVYKRIRDMVRGVVDDKRVQPNHAWRYTFKTHAHDAGLDNLTVDAICGHAARTRARHTGASPSRSGWTLMAAFPRYELTETARSVAA